MPDAKERETLLRQQSERHANAVIAIVAEFGRLADAPFFAQHAATRHAGMTRVYQRQLRETATHG